jgi:DNA end-binding protein Ku
VQLAEMGAADEFHPENYRDEVAERIRGMIQQKIDGEEITSLMTEEPKAQVIDLMEALKRSLGGSRSSSSGRGAKQAAARVPAKAETKRKPAKATAAGKPAAKRATR